MSRFNVATLPPIVKKILNLDGLGESAAEPVEAEKVNPFTKASTTADAPSGAATAATRPARGAQPFTPVEQGKTTKLVRQILRVAFALALFVVIVNGVKAMVNPPKQVVKMMPAKKVEFASGQAQAVTARWTRAYLGLPGDNDTGAKSRADALAADTAEGVNVTPEMTPKGKTTVSQVIPGEVSVKDDTHATAEVFAQVADVTTKTSKGKDGKETKTETTSAPRWVRLLVPVGEDGRRVVVTGTPVFSALPTPGEVKVTNTISGDTDTATTTDTKPSAEALFRAMGSDDAAAVNAVTAPGADVAPLGSGITFDKLADWKVSASSSSTRDATATVVWKLGSSGAEFTQTYRVSLSNVAAGGNTSWRVKSLTATPSQN